MRQFLFIFLILLSCTTSGLLAAQSTFEDKISAAVEAGDVVAVTNLCKDWYKSGQISKGQEYWNYNTLMSLEPEAVFWANSDAEAYSLWAVQVAQNIQPQAVILSTESLGKKGYIDFLAKWKNTSLKSTGLFAGSLSVFEVAAGKPVYFGVMLDKTVMEAEKQHLYITGLAMKFSREPFDNLAVLQKHYENDFVLDYLKSEMPPDPEPEKVAALHLNYLPSLLLLSESYTKKGNLAAAGETRDLAERIAKSGNREQEINAILALHPITRPANITVKTVEKTMKKVGDKLWASEVETTNEQYSLFLNDLLKTKQYELLDISRPLPTDWKLLLADSVKNVTDDQLFRHGHPDDDKMPVQQISYEAALYYCAWLTTAYNAAKDKKKFKKVVFRLPTEQEWMVAARGGRPDAPYPWGGYFIRNSKGCYLLNTNATKPCDGCDSNTGSDDGGFFTVPAYTYFPNDFGLYNMSGNVAEMVQEKGKSKGGSWQDYAYYNQVKPSRSYTGPNPATGFRVFMEVIEE